MYRNPGSPQNTHTADRSKSFKEIQNASGRVIALHLNFVAKPNGARELAPGLAATLEEAGLRHEGLESSVLLVSDREARLVTLLTFWDASRFGAGRERRIAWMQKLLAPFADGPIRAHTSLPRFLWQEQAPEAGLEETLQARDEELAEAAAG